MLRRGALDANAMDPITNPYCPVAGCLPPKLAGRSELLSSVRISIRRIRSGRHAKGVVMNGLRGVGKTVLLNRMREEAGAEWGHALMIESSETTRKCGPIAWWSDWS